MNNRCMIVALALGLAAGACRSVAPTTQGATASAQGKVKEAAVMEWKGQFSGAIQGGQRVIESAEQWQAAWSEIGQKAPAAPDFKTFFAVAVFLGQRNMGGYRVQWLEPDSTGSALVIRYKVLKPQDFGIQVLTHPYAVKVFPRGKAQIKVEAAAD
jgi:hypothetical protein